MGSSLLREWFFRPSTNIDLIRSRQDIIDIFILNENSDAIYDIRKSLRKLKNIPRILHDIDLCALSLSDWNALVGYLEELQLIIMKSSQIQKMNNTNLYNAIKSTFPLEKIKEVFNIILETVCFEKSALLNRVVVNEGLSSELDKIRKTYDNIEPLLASVAEKIIDSGYGFSEPLNVIYFPQLGYLIVISTKDVNIVETNFQSTDNQWSLIFSTETHNYYKNKDMRDMDLEYGDLFGIICDYELELIEQLQKRLSTYTNMILKSCNICAQLDCHLALALVAKQNNYVKPVMTEDRCLKIKDGYHPLYNNLVESFIPNGISLSYSNADSSLNESSENILLVTGANFSGKTVYLTQIALIVFMAHIGSFVPAKRAKIGIVDRILTRITTRESVSKSKSSFLNDLEQISSIFRLMTPRSLLIIDEFGKGTDTSGKKIINLIGIRIIYILNLNLTT